jgi:carbamoyl-phosphate synthase large subunit
MWLNEKVKIILITGCLGDISINMVRLLRDEGYTGMIIGADVRKEFFSDFFYDANYILPKASSPNYLEELESLVLSQKVDLLIPNSEAELNRLPDVLPYENYGVKVLKVAHSVIEVCLDKLKTVRFLEHKKLNFPITSVLESDNKMKLDFPCVIKPRFGQGSKDILILQNENQSESLKFREGYLCQELLGDEDQEFTCGLFRTYAGEIRTITICRRLMGGYTGYGEVRDNPEIEEYLNLIADGLGLVGSVNVQLRLTKRGPVCFEINPRFSSTILFRHKIGFRDFVWSLQIIYNNKIERYDHENTFGTRFYRGNMEYII